MGIQGLTKELSKQFGIKEGESVLINEVYEDDLAYAAGIKPGDIIRMVEDQPVDSPNQLSRLVDTHGLTPRGT